MYVYLGQDSFIKSRDIVGIFDLDNTTVSKITREALSKSEKNGRAVTVGFELPKSFVLCGKKKKRAGFIFHPFPPLP